MVWKKCTFHKLIFFPPDFQFSYSKLRKEWFFLKHQNHSNKRKSKFWFGSHPKWKLQHRVSNLSRLLRQAVFFHSQTGDWMQWQPEDAASQRKKCLSILIAVLLPWVRQQLPGFLLSLDLSGNQQKPTISHRCHSPDIMLQWWTPCLSFKNLPQTNPSVLFWHLHCLSAAPAMSAAWNLSHPYIQRHLNNELCISTSLLSLPFSDLLMLLLWHG